LTPGTKKYEKEESCVATFFAIMRLEDMERISLVRVPPDRRTVVVGLAHRERVRELAKFLGLDAESVAEGLVDAVDRDPALRQSTYLHRAA
jgi:hypothetical protein